MAVVIDIGTDYCKCGLAGDDAPRTVVPTILLTDTYVGETPPHMTRSLLSTSPKRPVEHGYVTDWDGMEKVLRNCFDRMRKTCSRNQPLLYTEPVLTPLAQRQRMLQLLFENFDVPATQSEIQAKLSVYTGGRSVSMAVECGAGVTQVYPVWEGYTEPAAIKRADFGGRDVTHYLGELLSQRGRSFPSTADQLTLDKLKIDSSSLAMDYNADVARLKQSGSLEKKYLLPSGEAVTLGEERLRCPESLFDPSLMGVSSPGVHVLAADAISACPIDIQRDLLRNVLLCGQAMSFPNCKERLQRELEQLFGNGGRTRVRVVQSPDVNAWVGGSIVASLSSFQRLWITADEYKECGPHALYRLLRL